MKRLFVLSFFFVIGSLCGCQKTSSPVYRFTGTLTVDGRTRDYLLNLPPDYYDSANFSLVIFLHGLAGSASQCERDYNFTAKADSERFVVVYPEGVRSDGVLGIRTWNAGSCCNYAADNHIDDVHFISVLIDELETQYKINRRKVYVTGISNGAMMAYRLACEIPGKIAAIAPVSGPLVTTSPFTPSRPVPILHIHSALDTKVPANGGTGLGGQYFPPVDSGLYVWASVDACSPSTPVVQEFDKYTLTQWQSCTDGTSILYYLTRDGGHAWPGGNKPREAADTPSSAFNANDLIWDFFKKYQLP